MRERIGAADDRLRAPVRSHNGPSTYANLSRGGSSAGYAMDDYEYTKPSDLARYDLDHDRPRSRNGRRDSVDRGNNYYRPSVNVVSHDYGARPAERRLPPTSRALDQYNRHAAAGTYERGTVVMPNLPAAPPSAPLVDPRRSGLLDRPASPVHDRRTSRPRPVSLYQDPSPRMDDLSFRARDENLHHERRERERERERDRDRDRERDRDETFRDEAVSSRGFGIRSDLLEPTEPRRPIETDRLDRRDPEEYRPHRDYDSREPKRRSDESLDKSRGRHERRSSVVGADRQRIEESRDRKEGKSDKMRDKVAAGLSVAAAAIGLGSAGKDKEKDDKDGRVSPRRAETEAVDARHADRYRPRDAEIERRSPPREEALYADERRDSGKERHERRDDDSSRERERQRERDRREKEREKDRSRRDQEASASAGKTEENLHSDESAAAASKRRQRSSAAFDPTDTKGLMDLKAELAAIDPAGSKDKDKPVTRERAEPDVVTSESGRDREREREREREPRGRDYDRDSLDRARDESRGRELAMLDADQKQVRVVSPPRDKADSKPVKGILKQPTSKFPEDANPIREGVAPHKDDKTKKDVPAGARWTKINRRMVNPEALTIGKERFEVRDDFVIVLRVLSKEEIQAYATATAQLREMRRKEYEKEHGDRDRDSDRGRDRDDEEHRKRHRHRRDRDDDDTQDRDRDDDREHSRRHRRDDEDDKPRAIEYEDHSRHHRSSHRDRDRDLETILSDDRR